MSKKSYNPFKLWGSYVGAVLLGILPLFILLLNNLRIIEGQYSWTTIFLFPTLIFGGRLPNLAIIINVILFIILGFFLGWGIHSIVRGLKR